jgi:hypothetical protein
MHDKDKQGAARRTSSIFGVYGGLLGFEHGIGEILQGNLPVPSIRINAYGSAGLPFPFGHEPAMTLLPTYLTTGIAAALAALLVTILVHFLQCQMACPSRPRPTLKADGLENHRRRSP